MTTDKLQPTPDPSQLGADTAPETTTRDDSHEMAPVIADDGAGTGRHFATQPAAPAQGSEFAEQRRQGAVADGSAPNGDAGPGQGMGHAGLNGDEDRGYEPGSYHGGLGSSGGREDLSERQVDLDQNPFAGGNASEPPASQTRQLGLNTPDPTPQPPQQSQQ